MHNPAKFHQDRSIRCRDTAIFRLFKMATVRHLGFRKVRILKLGMARSAHSRHRTKFRQNWSNDCEDIAI